MPCQPELVPGTPQNEQQPQPCKLSVVNRPRGMGAVFVDVPDDLERDWFEGRRIVGVTAGASAAELLVQRVGARLREWGGQGAGEIVGREEIVVFALPRELRSPAAR